VLTGRGRNSEKKAQTGGKKRELRAPTERRTAPGGIVAKLRESCQSSGEVSGGFPGFKLGQEDLLGGISNSSKKARPGVVREGGRDKNYKNGGDSPSKKRKSLGERGHTFNLSHPGNELHREKKESTGEKDQIETGLMFKRGEKKRFRDLFSSRLAKNRPYKKGYDARARYAGRDAAPGAKNSAAKEKVSYCRLISGQKKAVGERGE